MAYVATIAILVDVETETEAMDAVAETMRPLMKSFNDQSCLRDWMWCIGEDELVKVGSIPPDFCMDNDWPDAAPHHHENVI